MTPRVITASAVLRCAKVLFLDAWLIMVFTLGLRNSGKIYGL